MNKKVPLLLALLAAIIYLPTARAQGSGQFAGVTQCWVNGALVTVQGSTCPSAGTTNPSSAPNVSPSSSTGAPLGVQFVNVDTDPALRIPVEHICETPKGSMFLKISGSHGWLEISQSTVRYLAAQPGRYGKETDIGFEHDRSEVVELEMLSGAHGFIRDRAIRFRTQRITHYFSYSAPSHWDSRDKSVVRADDVYSPLILRAFQDFDGVMGEFRIKKPTTARPGPAQAVVAPEPKPEPPSPPPTVVLVEPSDARENGTVMVNESPLIIRGVAMDDSGLPTVTINGVPAALRPKDARAVEFWSDPLLLRPGDNPVQITASNSTRVETKLAFTIHYTPKPPSANPKALDKADIISLLVGGVPLSRVAGIVKERGVKFRVTADDIKEIRAAGGSDELIEAIQQAAGAP